MNILLVLLVSVVSNAEDRCVSAYDNKNAVVGMLEKSIGRSLTDSEWALCGGRAYVDPKKCATKIETKFKFEADKAKMAITITDLADEKIESLAKGMGKPGYAPLIKTALRSGIPFNALLCERENKTTYARLVGAGLAAGKGGVIEISQDAQGLLMTENLGADAGASK